MTGRVRMSSQLFSINREMSRPEGKAECEWKYQNFLQLDNKRPSSKYWQLGHIDCKTSNNMKSVALDDSEARQKN